MNPKGNTGNMFKLLNTENKSLKNIRELHEKLAKSKLKSPPKENIKYNSSNSKDNKRNTNQRGESSESKESTINAAVYKKKISIAQVTERTDRSEQSDVVNTMRSEMNDEVDTDTLDKPHLHNRQISEEIAKPEAVKASKKYSSNHLADMNKFVSVHNRQGSQPPILNKDGKEEQESNPINNNYLSSTNRLINLSPNETYKGRKQGRRMSTKKEKLQFNYAGLKENTSTEEENSKSPNHVKQLQLSGIGKSKKGIIQVESKDIKDTREARENRENREVKPNIPQLLQKGESFMKKPSYNFGDPLLPIPDNCSCFT